MKKSKHVHKKRKNENFEKQNDAFLSQVPRIIQPKNYVPRPKGMLCGPGTDGHTGRLVTKRLDPAIKNDLPFSTTVLTGNKKSGSLQKC